VSLSRDPNAATKIGNDAGALLWVGADSLLLIESPRRSGVTKTGYPDGGCSAEIYTNPNLAPYLEMELLAPLATLEAGNTSEATVVYSLFRRTQPTALQEARMLLAPYNSHPAGFSRASSAAKNPFASTCNPQPG
jgi:hypothetical protein